jgi:Outer membrane protein beta-barrel domain
MKKIILSLSILAIATLSANAQIKFGLKAGANVSNIIGDHSLSADETEDENSLQFTTKFGFNAGAFVNLPIKGKFSIQPEVIYSLQGANYKITNTDELSGDQTVSTGHLNLTYVQVPILAKLTFAHKFYLQTGPQLGFLMSAKDKFSGGTADVKSNYQSIDFAWGIGLGYTLPMGVGFDIRYDLGITAVDKTSSDDNSGADSGLKDHNSNLQVGVFYQFGGNHDDE